MHYAYKPLKMMVEDTIENQKRCINRRELLSTKRWLNEYCTLHFGMPRQTGNTTAGVKVALECFKNSLFLSFTHKNSVVTIETVTEFIAPEQEIKTITSRITTNNGNKCTFDGYRVFTAGHLRGHNFDGIFIDTSFMLSAREKETVRDEASVYISCNETFVLCFIE